MYSYVRQVRAALPLLMALFLAAPLMAQAEHRGEADLILPDLNSATFLGGIGGRLCGSGALPISFWNECSA